MKRRVKKLAKARPRRRFARLDEMVEEAIVDAYGESEQAVGLFTMIEDNLVMPFETKVLGVSVTVERVDIDDHDEIIAVCRRGRDRQRVPLLDLPVPSTRPSGWAWIEAYRHWRRGG